jgi:hypothetical protein
MFFIVAHSRPILPAFLPCQQTLGYETIDKFPAVSGRLFQGYFKFFGYLPGDLGDVVLAVAALQINVPTGLRL